MPIGDDMTHHDQDHAVVERTRLERGPSMLIGVLAAVLFLALLLFLINGLGSSDDNGGTAPTTESSQTG
jgi:hypothetical protein